RAGTGSWRAPPPRDWQRVWRLIKVFPPTSRPSESLSKMYLPGVTASLGRSSGSRWLAEWRTWSEVGARAHGPLRSCVCVDTAGTRAPSEFGSDTLTFADRSPLLKKYDFFVA